MLASVDCVRPVPASIPSPPAQPARRVSLGDMRACFRAIDQAQRLFGLTGRDWAAGARLSENSVHNWRALKRDARLSRFAALAAVVGYGVVMTGPDGTETDLRNLPAAIERIDAARCRQGLSLAEMEARSGASVSSYFAWRKARRDPCIANLVALAQTFDFTVEIRRTW